MNWIPVTERLPEDRRLVLTWGHTYYFGLGPSKPGPLGVTKCNRDGSVGASFDNERSGGRFSIGRNHVTHWCDIVAPAVQRAKGGA